MPKRPWDMPEWATLPESDRHIIFNDAMSREPLWVDATPEDHAIIRKHIVGLGQPATPPTLAAPEGVAAPAPRIGAGGFQRPYEMIDETTRGRIPAPVETAGIDTSRQIISDPASVGQPQVPWQSVTPDQTVDAGSYLDKMAITASNSPAQDALLGGPKPLFMREQPQAGPFPTGAPAVAVPVQPTAVPQPPVVPVVQGNIDIFNRPAVQNADGTASSVLSKSWNFDGKEVLLPTVSEDGRIMGDDEAVQQYRQTGQHLGVFATPAEASAYAEWLHQQQAAMGQNQAALTGQTFINPAATVPDPDIQFKEPLPPGWDPNAARLMHASAEGFNSLLANVASRASGGAKEFARLSGDPATSALANELGGFFKDKIQSKRVQEIQRKYDPGKAEGFLQNLAEGVVTLPTTVADLELQSMVPGGPVGRILSFMANTALQAKDAGASDRDAMNAALKTGVAIGGFESIGALVKVLPRQWQRALADAAGVGGLITALGIEEGKQTPEAIAASLPFVALGQSMQARHKGPGTREQARAWAGNEISAQIARDQMSPDRAQVRYDAPPEPARKFNPVDPQEAVAVRAAKTAAWDELAAKIGPERATFNLGPRPAERPEGNPMPPRTSVPENAQNTFGAFAEAIKKVKTPLDLDYIEAQWKVYLESRKDGNKTAPKRAKKQIDALIANARERVGVSTDAPFRGYQEPLSTNQPREATNGVQEVPTARDVSRQPGTGGVRPGPAQVSQEGSPRPEVQQAPAEGRAPGQEGQGQQPPAQVEQEGRPERQVQPVRVQPEGVVQKAEELRRQIQEITNHPDIAADTAAGTALRDRRGELEAELRFAEAKQPENLPQEPRNAPAQATMPRTPETPATQPQEQARVATEERPKPERRVVDARFGKDNQMPGTVPGRVGSRTGDGANEQAVGGRAQRTIEERIMERRAGTAVAADQSARADLDRLEAELEKDHSVPRSQWTIVDAPGRPDIEVAKKIARHFGKIPVVVRPETPDGTGGYAGDTFNAVVSRSSNRHVFLNVHANIDPSFAVVHEIGHLLPPDLQKIFLADVAKNFDLDRYAKDRGGHLDAGGRFVADRENTGVAQGARVLDEAASDAAGQMLHKSATWLNIAARIEANAPGKKSQAFLRKTIHVIDGAIVKAKTTFGIDQPTGDKSAVDQRYGLSTETKYYVDKYISDLRAMRRAVVDAFVETQKRVIQNRKAEGADRTADQPQRMIRVEDAKKLTTPLRLPDDKRFLNAVRNTKGARITDDGLVIDLIRFQKPNQEGERSVRTGVFYLPAGSRDARYYRNAGTNKNANDYGGTQVHRGETLLRRPFVVTATGGGMGPFQAFQRLRGARAADDLRRDLRQIISRIFSSPEAQEGAVGEFLSTYGGNPNDAYDIIANSREGTQLYFALQEHAIAHAVREGGYDAVVTVSVSSNPRVVEIFDVREQTYPSDVLNPEIHDRFTTAFSKRQEDGVDPFKESREDFDLEHASAKRLAAGSLKFEQLPYFDSYRKTVATEAGLLGDARDVVFVGSGPTPISPILFAKEHGMSVSGVELDANAARVGKKVAKREGISLPTFVGDAATYDGFGKHDAVVVALEAGITKAQKTAIFDRIARDARPNVKIIVRSSADSSGAFPNVTDYVRENFDIVDERPTFGGLSKSYLLRKKGSDTGTPVLSKRQEDRPDATPGFYSQLERVIDKQMPSSAPPDMVRAIMSKPQNGIRAEEAKWVDLDSLLDRAKAEGRKVTKQEILDHISENNVVVTEVKKGEKWVVETETDPPTFYDSEAEARDGATQLEDSLIDEASQNPEYHESQESEIRNRVHVRRAQADDNHYTGTQYHSYQLPGGKDYFELLLTMPSSTAGRGGQDYRSPHWNEPNILAHIRANSRTGPNGEKILHVEEFQSDWHQQGKRAGYTTNRLPDGWMVEAVPDDAPKEYVSDNNPRDPVRWVARDSYGQIRLRSRNATKESATRSMIEEMNSGRTDEGERRVPDAPFKKSWPMLTVKRMIRYAAENGYDKLTWTTGGQQAERYDLSKRADAIDYSTYPDGRFAVRAVVGRAAGNAEAVLSGRRSIVYQSPPGGLDARGLEDVFGKGIAHKILSGEGSQAGWPTGSGLLAGDGLKVGGAGMEGFYDQILPSEVNKYVKKWGARVGETAIDSGPEPGPGGRVHSIDITPSMRESVMGEGQPLFSKRNKEPKDPYVGSPGITSAQGLAKLRRIEEMLAMRGKKSKHWYEESARAILDLVGGDPGRAERLIQILSATSSHKSLPQNLQLALKIMDDFDSGMSRSEFAKRRYTFGRDMKDVENYLYDGVELDTTKRANFHGNLMSLIQDISGGTRHNGTTVDVWMMRAYGYDHDAPTPRQYAFVQRHTQQMASKLGWTQYQVQAAQWVYASSLWNDMRSQVYAVAKKRGIAANFKTKAFRVLYQQMFNAEVKRQSGLDPGVAHTPAYGRNFADVLKDHPVNWSMENVPGHNTGILSRIANEAKYPERVAYHSAIEEVLHQGGVDRIGKALNHFPLGGEETHPSAYVNEAGLLENNPATRVLIHGPAEVGGEQLHAIHPASILFNRAYAAIRGLLTHQEAVSGYREYTDAHATLAETNGVEFTTGRPLTVDEVGVFVQKLKSAAESNGMESWGFAPYFHSQGVTVVNVNPDGVPNKRWVELARQMGKSGELPGAPTVREFAASTFYDQGGPDGSGYREWIEQNGFGEQLRTAEADLAPDLNAVNNRYARDGWGSSPNDLGLRYSVRNERDLEGGNASPEGDQERFWHYSNADVRESGIQRRFAGTGAAGRERSRFVTRNGELGPESAQIHLYTPGGNPEGQVVRQAKYLNEILGKFKIFDLGDQDAVAAVRKAIIDRTGSPAVGPQDFINEVRSQGYDGMKRFDMVQVYRDIAPEEISRAIDLSRERAPLDENGTLMSVRQKEGANLPGRTNLEGEFDDMSTIDRVRRKVQDKLVRLAKVQNEIERAVGRPLREDTNVYLAEELRRGKTGDRLQTFEDTNVEPLAKRIIGAKKAGASYADVSDFLYATHAIERNAYLRDLYVNRKLDALQEELAFATPTEYQAISDEIDAVQKMAADGRVPHSGMDDKAAQDILDSLDDRGLTPQLVAIRDITDRIGREKLAGQVADGMLSQQQADAMSNRYQHYVPLKGTVARDAMTAIAGGSRPHTGQGLDIRGNETKRAFGRKTRASHDILSQLVMDAEEAVIRGEKNRVDQHLLRLVEEFPNSKIWELNPVNAGKVLDRDGVPRDAPNAFSAHNDPNVVGVKRNGKQYWIRIKDPDLARALKNTNTVNPIPVLSTATRIYSQLRTVWNPEFWVSNFARDFSEASINLSTDEYKALTFKVMRNTPKAIAGIYASERGHGRSRQWQKHFEEYQADGGKVSFIDLRGLDAQHRRIRSLIGEGIVGRGIEKLAGPNASAGYMVTKGHVRKMAELVGAVNDSIENGVRLSAYVAAREAGMSRSKAASLAKNLTLNFERHGEWGPVLSSTYAFANASIQGTARMAKTLSSPRAWKVLGSLAALSAMAPIWNTMVGGEDEEDGRTYWDKIDSSFKERNFILFLPGVSPKDYYARIPMPYGFSFAHVFGTALSDNIALPMMDERPTRNKVDIPDAAKKVALSAAGAFNPFSGVALNSWKDAKNLIVPSVLKPLFHIGDNRDWAGRPIKPENLPFGVQKPESELHFKNVSPALDKTADWLNQATGGNKVRSGKISISPEVMELALKEITGGVGRFGLGLLDTAGKVKAGKRPEIRQVPFVRGIVGNITDNDTGARYREVVTHIESLAAERRLFKDEELQRFQAKYAPFLRLVESVKASKLAIKMAQNNKALSEDEIRTRTISIQKKLLKAYLVAKNK